jgi:hypothetical protein
MMNARALRELLERHANEHGGTLSAELLVQLASHAAHPLHDRFEWDDKRAGHLFRVEQARQIIRSTWLDVTHEGLRLHAPFMVRDERLPERVQGYRPVTQVTHEREVARDTLRREIQGWRSREERLHALAAVLDLQDELDEMIQSADSVLHALETTA